MLQKYNSTPWFISRFVQRRREVSTNSRERASSRGADLSPYPPLPAIGNRRNSGVEAVSETPPSSAEDKPSTQLPPPLIRQDTYVVNNPLVVKGPKPRRKFKRGDAWGGKKDNVTPKQTSGGTFFTISVDDCDQASEPITNSESDNWPRKNELQNFQDLADNENEVGNKSNGQAYWFQC